MTCLLLLCHYLSIVLQNSWREDHTPELTMNGQKGFLCHYLFANGSAQYILLDSDDHGLPSVNRSISFCTETNLHVCAFCNGLLLLSSFVGNHLRYTVCNLYTKLSIPLPEPLVSTRDIGVGLAFDGQHYQVVRIFCIQVPRTDVAESSSAGRGTIEYNLEMEIFSSKTGLWAQHHPLIRLPPDLPKLSTTPLYSKGAIYWELGGFLLVYNASTGICRYIKLPNCSDTWSWLSMTFGQCLWDSGGYVHYCCTDYEGIKTWVLTKELDHHFKWKLVHLIGHQTLLLLNPEMFRSLEVNNPGFRASPWKPYFVSPCGFAEESQTMYLRLPGMFVSYNLRTRDLKEICSFMFPDESFHCCLLFPYSHNAQVDPRTMNPRSSLSRGSAEVVTLPLAGLQVRGRDAMDSGNWSI